jgi:D-amino-acid oxidase
MNPAAIIACPGIGARFLGGIEDKDVYPVRGQTILLRAPWIKYGRTLSRADGSYAYMMPRCTGDVRFSFFCVSRSGGCSASSKQVIVGGIKVANDW